MGDGSMTGTRKTRQYGRPRATRYYDENWDRREAVELERNGMLTYVEDVETGERDWKYPFELDR